MLTIIFILSCMSGTIEAEVPALNFTSIPITVINTWQIPYASDIQDIAMDYYEHTLVIRSNADGKLYLADPYDCEYQGEIELPAGSDGFGVAADNHEYYINSSTSPMIFHSDGTDSWSEFPNPAALDGAGMDINSEFWFDLCQATSSNSSHFYCMETDGSSYDSYGLEGVNDEISGFIGHEVFVDGAYSPYSVILTTRFGHEFFFFYQGSSNYVLYGQESCPIPVSESLGLALGYNSSIFWSYKGLDDEYYISELQIPIFGAIEEDPLADETGHLSTAGNPCTGSAFLTVNITGTEQILLEVFDLSGRLVEVLHNGQLAPGESTFGFSGSPGIYTAFLRHSGQEETIRLVLIR